MIKDDFYNCIILYVSCNYKCFEFHMSLVKPLNSAG